MKIKLLLIYMNLFGIH